MYFHVRKIYLSISKNALRHMFCIYLFIYLLMLFGEYVCVVCVVCVCVVCVCVCGVCMCVCVCGVCVVCVCGV